MAAKVTTATAILVLVLLSVRTSFLQTCNEPECMINDECSTNQVCRFEECIDPCLFNACGQEALCHVTNHVAACACPARYTGNPLQRCIPPDCQANVDCHSTEVCSNGKCLDPCKFVTCGSNTVCYTSNHSVTCTCPLGTTWDPVIGCKRSDKSECINNMSCALTEVCQDNKCQNPCWTASCGANTVCVTHDHTAYCFCKTGYVGNPDTGCVENSPHASIGGSDLGDIGNYTWRSTNTNITYKNWAASEPIHVTWNDGTKDNCIGIDSRGKWSNWSCQSLMFPICEYYD